MSNFGMKNNGFTVWELLVTLVMMSILSSVMLPTFEEIIKEQRLRQASAEFRSAVVLARSEAVKRNSYLGLVPKGTWDQGWCVNIEDESNTCNSDSVAEFGLSSDTVITSSADKIIFDDWGRTYNCPQLTISIDNCSVCMAVTTDGRVLFESGPCTQTCLSTNNDNAWYETCQ